jgi:hypothetical protein
MDRFIEELIERVKSSNVFKKGTREVWTLRY